jgi:MFS family permease
VPADALPQDSAFTRNLAGICAVELAWGLGMPVVIESTFLQVFLRNLGASSFLVGLIPTLMSAGTAVFSLISWSLTARLARKRGAVLAAHVAAAVPILAFGLLLGLSGIRPNTLSMFLAAYSLFAIGVGLILPAWQNYLVKIFSAERSIRALALMMIIQSAAKLAGSLWLVRVVERYSFSAAGSSLVFTLVGLLFLAGSFFFLLTVEQPEVPAVGGGGLRLSRLRARAGANRGFLLLLGTDLEYFALGGVIAFYANFATEYRGIAPALASGLFVAFAYLGGVLANALLGWANLLAARDKYLLTKVLGTAGILLLAAHPAPWVFYLVSLLFGASRGTRQMVFAPAVKRLSGASDATLYFAVSYILSLPFSMGLPLLNGAFLDRFESWGAWSYRSLFLGMAVLSLAGLYFTLRVPWKGPARGAHPEEGKKKDPSHEGSLG